MSYSNSNISSGSSVFVLPFTTFMSQFAFAISVIAMFVYIALNKDQQAKEIIWHILFVSSFIWNTECLSSNRECLWMAYLSVIYPLIYLVTFTYYNITDRVSIKEHSIKKKIE